MEVHRVEFYLLILLHCFIPLICALNDKEIGLFVLRYGHESIFNLMKLDAINAREHWTYVCIYSVIQIS